MGLDAGTDGGHAISPGGGDGIVASSVGACYFVLSDWHQATGALGYLGALRFALSSGREVCLDCVSASEVVCPTCFLFWFWLSNVLIVASAVVLAWVAILTT